MEKLSLRQKLGRNLRAYRKQLGLKQSELAEKAKKTQADISEIERGRCSATVDTIEALALALGISAGLLLREDSEEISEIFQSVP